jgi:hypothetical protein
MDFSLIYECIDFDLDEKNTKDSEDFKSMDYEKI